MKNTILITGSSSGIGKATARHFQRNCVNDNQFYVAINGRGRLDERPVYTLFYNHYTVLQGLSAPNTKAMAQLMSVAINPSVRSADALYSFASKGNPFWRLLHESGLTHVLLKPEEGGRLPEFGIGLASGVRRATRTAAELTRAEQRLGAKRVERVIAKLRPRYVALLGLTLYPIFFPAGTERGPGLKTDNVASSRVFVLPNPSGLNRAYAGFDKKLIWYRKLALLVRR